MDSFNERTQTWLVSDLRSKFELQSQILQRSQGYEDLSIYRASELWRLLLRRLRPELRLAPREFLLSWLTHHLKKVSKQVPDSLLQPQSAKSFVALMDLFAPIFLNPTGPAQLRQFFETHEEAAGRWQVWSELSYALFQVILNEKWILPTWIPAILVNEENVEAVWDRDLFVDLGGELRQSELELLKRLSKKVSVTAFVPQLKSGDAFSFLLQPSEELKKTADQRSNFALRESAGNIHCLRFSGPLAEVKQAVAQVRKWAEEGVELSKIAIVAPEIEDYWPLLEPFLEKEGLAVQKDSVTRLKSWPTMNSWLARLRLRSGQVSFSDIEEALNTDELKIRFERFRSLFVHALELEDLERSSELESFFSRNAPPKEDLDLQEFMAWTARDWRDYEKWEGFEILLKDMLQLIPEHVRMDLDAWIGYLESLAAKKEIRLKAGDLTGVALINLASVDGGNFEKRIFLGLNESNFKKKSTVLVGAHELDRLGWDFGYFLDHPEQNLLNFYLEWALQNPSNEDQLYSPSTGFGGSAEAAHPVWIRHGGTHSVQNPLPTRWDEIQNSDQKLTAKFLRDSGQITDGPMQLPVKPNRFSISTIEKYRSCSFQFAAERLFHLLDLPERDLDLDDRTKGNLVHKLFEKLTDEPGREWSDAELGALLDQIKTEIRLEDREGLFWEIDRERHVQLGQRFLRFEKEWARQYPEARIAAREKNFQFYFDPAAGAFKKDGSEQDILIRGTIDRVDRHPNGWNLVVDYKTRHDSKRSFSNWIKKNSLQYGFYAWVVDRGFVEGLEPGSVGGVVTYSYRVFEKRRGFVLPEIQGLLAPKVDPKGASIESKEGFYQEFEPLLVSLLQKALSGDVQPRPFEDDETLCESCRWSKVCRAVHLNT